MKVIQEDERTYRVILNNDELSDLIAEASYSQLSLLDVMKSIFLMTFVQVMSCRYFRRILRQRDDLTKKDIETALDSEQDLRV